MRTHRQFPRETRRDAANFPEKSTRRPHFPGEERTVLRVISRETYAEYQGGVLFGRALTPRVSHDEIKHGLIEAVEADDPTSRFEALQVGQATTPGSSIIHRSMP